MFVVLNGVGLEPTTEDGAIAVEDAQTMVHIFIVHICKCYQRLFFAASHLEESQLVALHHPKTMDQFHAEYIRSEMAKGERLLAQFGPFAVDMKDATVLDFGCGGGGITFRLGER